MGIIAEMAAKFKERCENDPKVQEFVAKLKAEAEARAQEEQNEE